MKLRDELKQNLISSGHTPAHISPAIEALCSLMDRRLEQFDKRVASAHTKIHALNTKGDRE